MDKLPALKGDEVKVKLIYGGICGSDLRVFQGKLQYASYPLRPGHELIGTVIDVGDQLDLALGTRVVVQPNTYCSTCKYCLSGKTNICPNKKSIGVNADGGFSEQFVMSSKYLLPIPADLSNERAILIEPFAVIVHAFKKVLITKDTSVAIIGCGNEGLLAVALAQHLGANVTALDINPVKLELVRTLGDIRALHPDEINNETFEIVVESAGTSKSIELGVQLVERGGAMLMIGITQEAVLPVVHMVRNEITLYGSIIYNAPDDFLQAIEYLRNDDFNVSPVLSKIVPLTEFKHAYEMALSGDYGKVVLAFENGK